MMQVTRFVLGVQAVCSRRLGAEHPDASIATLKRSPTPVVDNSVGRDAVPPDAINN